MSEEALLQRLLAGELDADSDEGRRLLREHPEVRERLQLIEAALRSAGDEYRGVLEEAAVTRDVQGEETAVDLVRGHFERRSDSREVVRRASPLRWLVPFLGAAAVALLLWRPFVDEETEGPDLGPELGTGVSELSHTGATGQRLEFSWSAAVADHHYFRVFVYNKVDSDGSQPIADSPELEQPAWTPDPEQVTSWPREIRWEVVVFDGQTPIERAEASASLRLP